jgi:hypothetical protein
MNKKVGKIRLFVIKAIGILGMSGMTFSVYSAPSSFDLFLVSQLHKFFEEKEKKNTVFPVEELIEKIKALGSSHKSLITFLDQEWQKQNSDPALKISYDSWVKSLQGFLNHNPTDELNELESDRFQKTNIDTESKQNLSEKKLLASHVPQEEKEEIVCFKTPFDFLTAFLQKKKASALNKPDGSEDIPTNSAVKVEEADSLSLSQISLHVLKGGLDHAPPSISGDLQIKKNILELVNQIYGVENNTQQDLTLFLKKNCSVETLYHADSLWFKIWNASNDRFSSPLSQYFVMTSLLNLMSRSEYIFLLKDFSKKASSFSREMFDLIKKVIILNVKKQFDFESFEEEKECIQVCWDNISPFETSQIKHLRSRDEGEIAQALLNLAVLSEQKLENFFPLDQFIQLMTEASSYAAQNILMFYTLFSKNDTLEEFYSSWTSTLEKISRTLYFGGRVFLKGAKTAVFVLEKYCKKPRNNFHFLSEKEKNTLNNKKEETVADILRICCDDLDEAIQQFPLSSKKPESQQASDPEMLDLDLELALSSDVSRIEKQALELIDLNQWATEMRLAFASKLSQGASSDFYAGMYKLGTVIQRSSLDILKKMQFFANACYLNEVEQFTDIVNHELKNKQSETGREAFLQHAIKTMVQVFQNLYHFSKVSPHLQESWGVDGCNPEVLQELKKLMSRSFPAKIYPIIYSFSKVLNQKEVADYLKTVPQVSEVFQIIQDAEIMRVKEEEGEYIIGPERQRKITVWDEKEVRDWYEEKQAFFKSRFVGNSSDSSESESQQSLESDCVDQEHAESLKENQKKKKKHLKGLKEKPIAAKKHKEIRENILKAAQIFYQNHITDEMFLENNPKFGSVWSLRWRVFVPYMKKKKMKKVAGLLDRLASHSLKKKADLFDMFLKALESKVTAQSDQHSFDKLTSHSFKSIVKLAQCLCYISDAKRNKIASLGYSAKKFSDKNYSDFLSVEDAKKAINTIDEEMSLTVSVLPLHRFYDYCSDYIKRTDINKNVYTDYVKNTLDLYQHVGSIMEKRYAFNPYQCLEKLLNNQECAENKEKNNYSQDISRYLKLKNRLISVLKEYHQNNDLSEKDAIRLFSEDSSQKSRVLWQMIWTVLQKEPLNTISMKLKAFSFFAPMQKISDLQFFLEELAKGFNKEPFISPYFYKKIYQNQIEKYLNVKKQPWQIEKANTLKKKCDNVWKKFWDKGFDWHLHYIKYIDHLVYEVQQRRLSMSGFWDYVGQACEALSSEKSKACRYTQPSEVLFLFAENSQGSVFIKDLEKTDCFSNVSQDTANQNLVNLDVANDPLSKIKMENVFIHYAKFKINHMLEQRSKKDRSIDDVTKKITDDSKKALEDFSEEIKRNPQRALSICVKFSNALRSFKERNASPKEKVCIKLKISNELSSVEVMDKPSGIKVIDKLGEFFTVVLDQVNDFSLQHSCLRTFPFMEKNIKFLKKNVVHLQKSYAKFLKTDSSSYILKNLHLFFSGYIGIPVSNLSAENLQNFSNQMKKKNIDDLQVCDLMKKTLTVFLDQKKSVIQYKDRFLFMALMPAEDIEILEAVMEVLKKNAVSGGQRKEMLDLAIKKYYAETLENLGDAASSLEEVKTKLLSDASSEMQEKQSRLSKLISSRFPEETEILLTFTPLVSKKSMEIERSDQGLRKSSSESWL